MEDDYEIVLRIGSGIAALENKELLFDDVVTWSDEYFWSMIF
ncbi:hypothetical protein RV07_GL001408 [Enterococcus malodoratus]|nr:hypothetical protein [Enterococcus malodoratus]OJG65821.1 hypothetical protein RV07_GL001408 [Enterococcus malodoratus]